jgi:predicted O-linked N-acetylglucosamine transferase (SPINDLY family)
MTIAEEAVPNAQTVQAGIECYQSGRLADAERICRHLLDADSSNADAWHLLGVISGQRGESKLSFELISKAIELEPQNPIFRNNLGNALKGAGESEQAEQSYRKALVLKPDFAEASSNLGFVLHDLNRLEEAAHSFGKAIELNPAYAEAHHGLGVTQQDLGHPDKAELSYRRALTIRPDYFEAKCNLGQALRAQGRLQEAEACLRDAIAIRENFGQAHNNLANVLRIQGRVEEADRSYRRAVELDSGNAAIFSNLLFQLNYVPGKKPADIFAEHREFARRFCAAPARTAHANAPQPDRRIRIGYVSGDFRDHAVAFFIEPILARHDRREYEVVCYYTRSQSDAVTRRLRLLADHWRDVLSLSDEGLDNLIRRDSIDILVDLSGHSAGNRLVLFGRKPAPVQATWLGYLNTSGLEAMDFRITDAHASPEGLFDKLHTEKVVRLPDSQWCYRPPVLCPDVSPPPCAEAGHITFAILANLAKVGQPMIDIWSRLLARVPSARLLVVGASMNAIPPDYSERFTRLGVSGERLTLLGWRPFPDYLALHKDADIILDTYPYSGGTTTCHALWMGVPVISLAGDTATSRGGASLLHAVGLDEFIAATPEQYLNITAALAASPRRLAELRAGMRERMSASLLMDEERFTRNLENAYRLMWRTWCERQSAGRAATPA